MNKEIYEDKTSGFFKTKKGASILLFLVVCVFLTLACYFDMFAPTRISSALTRQSDGLINLDNQELPFEVKRADALTMTFTSVKSDLSVTIKNQDAETVAGYPFIASLSLKDSKKDSKNEPITLTDTNKDGLIYFDKLEEGDYMLELTDVGDYNAPDPIKITIEPPVEHKKIDVSKKIVSQSNVNLAADDGKYGNSTSSFTRDTVEFVKSRVETIKETINTPSLDGSGKQIYNYIPVLGGDNNMYLTTTDNTVTDLRAVLDTNGYLVMGQTPETSSCKKVPVIDSNYNLIAYGDKDIKAEKITATITEYTNTTVYYGWQKINNRTYYFDKNGNKVTGKQTIQGMDYFFNDDGSVNSIVGIDVSTYQGNINWAKVKASGVTFAIIRIGFRGYGTGKLVEDDKFTQNIAGAKAAGIKVGVYFFDVAITELEAVEEASMCLQMLNGQSLDYPIFIDHEYAASSARNNSLSVQQRTMICEAFCNTIRNNGYRAGVYSSVSYLNNKMNMSTLSKYSVWCAHWGVKAPSYGGRYDVWQYSDSGKVDGINGSVDMNISYMGY